MFYSYADTFLDQYLFEDASSRAILRVGEYVCIPRGIRYCRSSFGFVLYSFCELPSVLLHRDWSASRRYNLPSFVCSASKRFALTDTQDASLIPARIEGLKTTVPLG